MRKNRRVVENSGKIRESQKKILLLLSLLPIILISSFVGAYLWMLEDIKSYAFQTPDTSYFVSEDEIDLTILRELATEYEIRQELFHTPNNISQTISINRYTEQIISLHGTDNGGLHTAENLVASCFRYASLPEGEEKEQALCLIEKMFYAIRMMIEVPNGGLGPEYPGATLARFYASPEMLQDGNYTWIMSDYFRHRNGTGQYSQWRVRLYTSKDEIAGMISALAVVQMLVDVPEIQAINDLLIAQVVEGYIDTNWQQISEDGKPDGAHLNPPSEPQWKLSLLKMALNAYPENIRYQQLYNYQLNKELAILDIGIQGDHDIIDNYYGLYFGAHVVLAMLLVEDNPKIVQKYFKNLDDSYHSFAGHRNAFLNMIYLAGYAKCKSLNPDTQASFNIKNIVWDVKDQLWRFHTSNLFPFNDAYGNQNRTITREEKDPQGLNWTLQDPNVEAWRQRLDSNWWGTILKFPIDSFMDGVLDDHYLLPATVDMIPASETIWNKNPFKVNAGYGNAGVIVNEFAGASFSLPYWMLSYYGYLEEE